jgi:hypothetical protein
MSTEELTQEEVRLIGLEVLGRELGATGLIRFLQLYEHGSGDYTQERADLLRDQTVDQITERIVRRRSSAPESGD